MSSIGMANLGDKRALEDMGTSRGLMAARLTLGYLGVKLTIRLCVMIVKIADILFISLYFYISDSVLIVIRMIVNHLAIE